MDSRRDFTSKKVFSGYFSELGEKANSALLLNHPPGLAACLACLTAYIIILSRRRGM